MILTADDYDRFYSANENRSFVEELWRSHRLLAIGFGFRDPILSRLAETVIRSVSGENQHFAIIGSTADEPITPLLRRQFSKKFRVEPIFYKVSITSQGYEDHSSLQSILEHLGTPLKGALPTVATSSASNLHLRESPSASAERDFKDGLFVGPNGQTLYVDPLITSLNIAGAYEDYDEVYFSVGDIISQPNNVFIACPLESGGTTLARRLVLDLTVAGREAVYRDALKLPNYKKKLLDDKAFRSGLLSKPKDNVLIIDNFDVGIHARLLKEIVGINAFEKVVLVARARGDDVTSLGDLGVPAEFRCFNLHYLSRSEVRTLASQLYDTFDGDLVSAAVEKTYNDLLELCIPLTPSNVIMYLSVVHREGSFTPLNRLQIMERFIRDLLHRPGDLYRDSFNADNKMDVISSFVYEIFLREKATFTKLEWDVFCDKEMAESLIWFDKEALLNDLIATRLFIAYGSSYIFKYKMFYSYFVGKHVAQRPRELETFVQAEHHLKLDGLVETIAGSSKDNTFLVTDLVNRLETAIGEFETTYDLHDFDPYEDLQWLEAADEQKSLWQPITSRLASGPAEDSEVDRLKRSIVAESKTADQSVVIREFSEYQRSVTFLQSEVIAALRESQKLDRDLKARAMRAVYASYKIVMQIGFLFAPIIATRRFFAWNNVAFYNQMNWPNYEDSSEDDKIAMIASAVPRVVVNKAADDLGSRKLASLYDHMSQETNSSDFDAYLSFALVLRTKPEGWQKTAREILDRTDRQALYLRYMLSSAMRQFNQEVNTSGERTALKRVVATVQAKRMLKKANPNTKTIDQTLTKLEKTDYFERSRRAVNSLPKADVPALEAEAEKLLNGGAVDVFADEVDENNDDLRRLASDARLPHVDR
ncbi:hypothetical protein NS277_07885 [Novosphingobium barchaimii]|nr:hypothetical protein NS277_07885 [Novosphingobium barchaimii]